MKKNSLHINTCQFLQSKLDDFYQVFANDSRVDIDLLKQRLDSKLSTFSNPNTNRFFSLLNQLPIVDQVSWTITSNILNIDFNDQDLPLLLKQLRPWRKGPFKIGKTIIDSEWQSQLKWDRFSAYFSELSNQRILDIGCGNGYYMFQMLKYNPRMVLGIDPSDLTFFQYHSIQHFVNDQRLHYLPIGFNDLSPFQGLFDVVFCMGIMYHHRSPIDLFKMIRHVANDRLTMFFDTLIIDGDDDVALFPSGRYAQMPNVYFIPTINGLKNMLSRGGFKHIDVLSIDETTSIEQRVTQWTFEKSLDDFLDPNDNTRTIEGYPAPKRVALIAK